MAVYFLGGSPCSGKSTVAQALSDRFGLAYFKVDDHLNRYLKMGANAEKPCCAAVAQMTPEQIWMRDPQVQCDEELLLYREIYEYIIDDLAGFDADRDVITEGAAWLPVLARQARIPFDRYISITPTKDFQVHHYSKREWVSYVLEGCSDKSAAFDNWMERDARFALAVQQQCREAEYASIVHHGEISIEQLIDAVAVHFHLK